MNVCDVFDIVKIGTVVFTINRFINVPKISNFSWSILKIPAKNYVGLINFGRPCIWEFNDANRNLAVCT